LIFVEVMFKENKACNIVSKIKNTMSFSSTVNALLTEIALVNGDLF